MIPAAFHIKQQDNERLITPGFKITNKHWQEWKNRWLRSLHINKQNHIISSGFPKFLNMGEGSGRYHVSQSDILDYVARQEVWATLKIDGSLLIRFVQDGCVKWRTRGSFGMESCRNAYELDRFIAKYPLLADPKYYSTTSLLFEWVSPSNRIVIKYDEPGITLVGGVTYRTDRPWHMAEPKLLTINKLQDIAHESEMPLVEHFQLKNKDEIERLLQKIKQSKDIEGFVLRFNDCQEMVKIKSDLYLIFHALKSNLTTAKLVELWLLWKQPSFTEFAEQFQQTYDYETWQWVMPVVSSMFDGIRRMKGIIGHVREFAILRSNICDRRTFAMEAQERFNQIRLSLCFIMYDNKPIPHRLLQKLVLQNCKQMEKTMFDEE